MDQTARRGYEACVRQMKFQLGDEFVDRALAHIDNEAIKTGAPVSYDPDDLSRRVFQLSASGEMDQVQTEEPKQQSGSVVTGVDFTPRSKPAPRRDAQQQGQTPTLAQMG